MAMAVDLSSDLAKDEVLEALNRILSSEEFQSSPQIQSMLRFVVDQELSGRGGQIKAYSIAVDVLERPASFDPQNDSIVRVIAGRLRNSLGAYYEGSGQHDPIRIELPKGGYRPIFHRQAIVRPAAKDDLQTESGHVPNARSRWIVAGLFIIGTLLLATIAFFETQTNRQLVSTGSPPRPPNIGISLFTNLSDDRALDSFAFGLQFDLVSKLSTFSWLSVFVEREERKVDSTADNPRYRSDGPDADYLLSGAVYVDESSVMISYQLREERTQIVRWAKTYERDLGAGSIFGIQRDAAIAIAVEIGRPEGIVAQIEAMLHRSSPGDLNAYLCVLRIYDYWRSFSTEEHLNLRQCLEQAIDADPVYAEAYAALSFIYLDEFRYGTNKRQGYDALERSLELAMEAVKLDPFSTMAKQAFYTANIVAGDLDTFVRVGRQALAQSPHNPELLADFGNKLAIRVGHWREAARFSRRALELNPDPAPWYFLTPAYRAILASDYDEALRWANRINTPEWFPYHMIRAIALSNLGDGQATRDELQLLTKFTIDNERDARRKILELKFEPGLEKSLIEGLTGAFHMAKLPK